MDYMVGILLLIAPWLFGFQNNGAQTIVPMILGGTALVYSLFTNYELGLFRLLPMRTHLMMDLLSGIVLAASPWLWGFNQTVYLPHLVLGIFEILASVTTSSRSFTANRKELYGKHAH
jgi:hypothetical protein